MTSETKIILNKLDEIKSELDYIKNHMADVDTIITTDDIESLKEAEDDLKNGKTVRL
ncbi:MAG TPA: hypothetical protein VJJ52_02195 [Candidatus Nanoarchaeia archaeon]|nr:hypothetical protein [Candidatus Nanoarchaeia archaeon]